jgi:alkyl hydroperoxide reductase subunit AhpF
MIHEINKTAKKHLILGTVTRFRYVWDYGVRKVIEYQVKTWRCPHCDGEVFKGVHNRKPWDKKDDTTV